MGTASGVDTGNACCSEASPSLLRSRLALTAVAVPVDSFIMSADHSSSSNLSLIVRHSLLVPAQAPYKYLRFACVVSGSLGDGRLLDLYVAEALRAKARAGDGRAYSRYYSYSSRSLEHEECVERCALWLSILLSYAGL